ncbi:MAG: hypothetical protein HZA52_06890 [Planctomycetes bacterium]|nr:hypothetical protein [Planctomycetota bacterium]
MIVLACLLGLEFALRAFGFGYVVGSESSARYGWRMLPEQTVAHAETGIETRTNALGFRDREWGEPAPDPSRTRVAWLGNSMIWGGNRIRVEQRCDRQLEELAARRLDDGANARPLLAMNFAQPGYTFEQMARVWEDLVRPFRPDVLIVPLCAYDIRPMRASIDRVHYPLWRTVESSALFDLYKRIAGGGWHPELARAELDVELSIADDPFAPEHLLLRIELDARIEEVLAQARSLGTRVIVVALPTLADFTEPDRRWFGDHWAEWCAERGVDFVDPRPRFRTAMQPLFDELAAKGLGTQDVWGRFIDHSRAAVVETRAAACFHFDDPTHFTPRGHLALADALVDAVLPVSAR